MRYLIGSLILLFSGCGVSKSFTSSVPTIGEATHVSVKVIKMPEVEFSLRPNNDLKTGEFRYVVLPIVPVGWNSDVHFADGPTPGEFKVQLALFAHQQGLSLKFSDINLILKGEKYNVSNIQRVPYAHYGDSQALNTGTKWVMCPESQKFDGALPNETINLTSNGMWECYNLVFPVDTPDPRGQFQMEILLNNKDYKVQFEPYEWGHADSIP